MNKEKLDPKAFITKMDKLISQDLKEEIDLEEEIEVMDIARSVKAFAERSVFNNFELEEVL